MMKKILIVFLFALLFTGGICFPQDSGYKVYKSLVSGEQGEIFLTVGLDNCSADIVCDGENSLSLYPDGQFELCWTAGSLKCETGPLIVSEIGTHYFKIYGFDRIGLTPPTNEAILTIEERIAPPSGCSIRKF